MRLFRKSKEPPTAWVVEVDYGDGFVPYSGSLDERSADIFVRDLRRTGRKARVVAERDAGPLHAVGREPRSRHAAIDRRVLLWELGVEQQKDSSLGG
jgi:hypothetical protein